MKSYPTGGSSAIIGLHLGACSLKYNLLSTIYYLIVFDIKYIFVSFAIVKPRAVSEMFDGLYIASLSSHYLFIVDKVHMYFTSKQIYVFVMALW